AMHVWNSSNPMPSNALREADLTKSIMADYDKQVAAIWPKGRSGLSKFRATALPAIRQSLAFGPALNPASHAASGNGEAQTVVIAAYTSDASNAERLKELLKAMGQNAVVLILEEKPMSPDALWKEFYSTYNRTKLGDDVRTLAEVLNTAKPQVSTGKVELVGMGECGLPALFARALSGIAGKTVVDTAGFDNQSDDAFLARLYAPGLRRIGDVQTAAMLAAPDPLCV